MTLRVVVEVKGVAVVEARQTKPRQLLGRCHDEIPRRRSEKTRVCVNGICSQDESVRDTL